jgi:hypothetical protein
VRLTAAYDLKGFDGWAVTRYRRAAHAEQVVLTT